MSDEKEPAKPQQPPLPESASAKKVREVFAQWEAENKPKVDAELDKLATKYATGDFSKEELREMELSSQRWELGVSTPGSHESRKKALRKVKLNNPTPEPPGRRKGPSK